MFLFGLLALLRRGEPDMARFRRLLGTLGLALMIVLVASPVFAQGSLQDAPSYAQPFFREHDLNSQ